MFKGEFVSGVLHGLVNALNSVNSTIWGVIVLFISMLMCWHGKTNEGYYFAGVGSTLLGIKGDDAKASTKTISNGAVTTTTEVK